MFGMRYSDPSLQDDALRARLQEAILDGDAAQFRAILQEAAPDLAREPRCFGVLVPTAAGGMETIMVDQTGRRFVAADVIPAGTPMEMLNVTYLQNEMVVTFEGKRYAGPYPEKMFD